MICDVNICLKYLLFFSMDTLLEKLVESHKTLTEAVIQLPQSLTAALKDAAAEDAASSSAALVSKVKG